MLRVLLGGPSQLGSCGETVCAQVLLHTAATRRNETFVVESVCRGGERKEDQFPLSECSKFAVNCVYYYREVAASPALLLRRQI